MCVCVASISHVQTHRFQREATEVHIGKVRLGHGGRTSVVRRHGVRLFLEKAVAETSTVLWFMITYHQQYNNVNIMNLLMGKSSI